MNPIQYLNVSQLKIQNNFAAFKKYFYSVFTIQLKNKDLYLSCKIFGPR